jgi:hypothetical protein
MTLIGDVEIALAKEEQALLLPRPVPEAFGILMGAPGHH